MYYVLVHWEGADWKVVGVKFMTVCHAEGFSLLLAKDCDRIAALTHFKQNHPLKLSVFINRTAVYG